MPRPQFMMVNGKAVCVTKAGGKTRRKGEKQQEIAAIQRQRAQDAQKQKTSEK